MMIEIIRMTKMMIEMMMMMIEMMEPRNEDDIFLRYFYKNFLYILKVLFQLMDPIR